MIRIDDAIFTQAGPVGALAASAFRIGSAALDADDHIVYDNATGALFYDADGTGATVAVRFANLAPGLAPTNADFVIF